MTFVTMKDEWKGLVPNRRTESLTQVRRFFNCVRSLMSVNLRSMALASLDDFVAYMGTYSGGNVLAAAPAAGARGGQFYRDGEFLAKPLLSLRLEQRGGKVEFVPSLEETWQILVECLKEIVASTERFPRIETELFHEMAQSKMYLLPVGWQEDHVQECVRKVEAIFRKNTEGPAEYVRMYDKYSDLLDGEADREKDVFLAASSQQDAAAAAATLENFKTKMDKYLKLSREIGSLRSTALLNLFHIDAADLNAQLAKHAAGLRDELIQWQV